jgi:hypothetical protein
VTNDSAPSYIHTGRATCKGCAALIGKGEWRLGLPAWVGGRKVTVWQHPGCALARSVAVERAANGLARCKATGHRFEKGELRGLLAVGGAKLYYRLPALGAALRPVLALRAREGRPWQPQDAGGFAGLDGGAQAAVVEALSPDS